MSLYKFPLSGVLCKGQFIILSWAEPEEFDKITRLRNSERVRHCFLMNNSLEESANRHWLSSKIKKPTESMLSIRWIEGNKWLGTCGWSDWDQKAKTVWLGRLMIDYKELRSIANLIPPNYVGPVIDAAITLRDFTFKKLNVKEILTFHFAGNKLSENVVKKIGLVERSRSVRERPDGDLIETVNMSLTKARWEKMKANY